MSHNSRLYKSAKDTLLKEQKQIKNALANLHRDDPFSDQNRTADNASPDTDAFEDSEHMRIETQQNELRTQMGHIEEALIRIENGEYGTCASCGKPIDENRLRAMPAAPVCITCEKQKS